MSTLTLNLTQTQSDQIQSFFNGLTGAGGLSSADYTALADALEFGTLEEVSLSGTRYEVNLFGLGHVARGSVIYTGSAFQTSGWDGNPLTLTDGVINISSVINGIEIKSSTAQTMFAMRGGLSGIQMIGSDTTAGSFTLTELQLGSQAGGEQFLFKGNLTASLTSPNMTVSGSLGEVSFYVRQGSEAFELKISGNLTPNASLMEQGNGDITTLSSGLGGEINGLAFTKYTYADGVSQTPTATQAVLDAGGLHLSPEDLGGLMSAASHGLGPDISFSQDGQVATDAGLGLNEGASTLALQSDGKVLVGGTLWGTPNVAIFRYNPDGSLDTSFSADGKVVTTFATGWGTIAGVAQDSANRILVGGSRDGDFTVMRFTSDGNFDTSFSGVGMNRTSGLGSGSAFTLQADGKALVVGSNNVARYATNGSLDATFSGDGIATAPIAMQARSISVDSSGKILVAGSYNNDFALVRYNADGAVDTSFNGGSGYVVTTIGTGWDDASRIVLQGDGKILVGGTSYNGSNNDLAIVRYNADGTLDSTFWGTTGQSKSIVDAGTRIGLGSTWDQLNGVMVESNGDIKLFGTSGTESLVVTLRSGGWIKSAESFDTGFYVAAAPVRQADGAILFAGLEAGDFAVGRMLDSQTAIDQILLNGDDALTLNTDAGADLHGYKGNDTLATGSGNDRLLGGEGNDMLNAGTGQDHLSGGPGADTMTGGSGADLFVIDNLATTDTITDFNPADDTIVLVGSHFTNSVTDRVTRFKLTTEALDADDRILYNSVTGAVLYDADGSGAAAALQFATLSGTPTITYADFYLNPTNAPILLADTATTTESSTVSIDVLANDYLPDGWSLAWSFATNGTVVKNDKGQLEFTPGSPYDALKSGESATATFNYMVMNQDYSGSAQGTVNATVNGANDAPRFGIGDGKVTTAVDYPWSTEEGRSVTLQADGKILVAGYSNSGFALMRYNSNGSLDTSFDGDGKVTTMVGTNSSQGYGVSLQSDGKILVGGIAYDASSGQDFALVRYNSNGTLDTSFDGDGKVLTAVSLDTDFGRSIAVQSDGKILLAGRIGGTSTSALVRYNTDGSLDTSFDVDGKVVATIDSAWASEGQIVAVQADGKILLAGSSLGGGQDDFAIARYNSNGSLDATFDGDGKVVAPIGSNVDRGNSVAVQADGKILLAGFSYNVNNYDFSIARFNPDGSLDSSFDGDGKVITAVSSGNDYGYSVTVQADGKILVAGISNNGVNDDFAVVRYNIDGSLDSSFDGDGKVITAVGVAGDRSYSVTVQADGRILVAGSSYGTDNNNDFALVRYNPDGTLDSSFDLSSGTTYATYVEASPVIFAEDQFKSLHIPSIGGFFDPDNGDVLSFIATRADGSPLPGWLSFNASANTLSGTPNNADVGTLSIRITASDSGGLSANNTFVLNVTNANDAPTVTNPIADRSTAEDTAFSFTVPANTFADADAGDSLTYIATRTDGAPLPGWLSFNAGTRTFSGLPANSDVGILNIRVTARDSSNAAVSEDFALTIADTNDAPVVNTGTGIVTTAVGAYHDYAESLIVQGDGKILLAGYSNTQNGSNWDMSLVRYTQSGLLDTTFGTTGKIVTDLGADETGLSVATQADGKILLAGYGYGNYLDFALIRYNVDGSLDVAFNGNGKVLSAIGAGYDGARSIKVQTDGKIVVVGFSANGATAYDFAIARYNTNGSLDDSFDGDGRVTTDIGGFTDQANSVAIQSDGKIIVAGQSQGANANEFALIRLNSNGTLDTSFGGTGKVTTDINTRDDAASSVIIQSNGKILVAGSSETTGLSGGVDFALVRYNADGTLDTSFDGDGKLVTNIQGFNDYAGSVALQTDGKIIVAGKSYNGIDDDFAVVRYNSNGSLDSTFDGDGKVVTNLHGQANSILVQADGKILVGGSSVGNSNYMDFALVRYHPDGSLDTAFGLNGSISATATENSAFTYSLPHQVFADPDAGDTLTLTATRNDEAVLPSWLTFNPTTSTFSGIPTNADVGTLNLKVTATDTGGLSVSDTFTLTVANFNDAPTIANPIADRSTTEDTAFSFTVPANTFADADAGDSLTYIATRTDGAPLPGWLSFNSGTRTFSGTATNGDVGPINVRVTTRDGSNATVSDDFILNVINTNDPPALTSLIADKLAFSDLAFDFQFPVSTFSDVDVGDTFTFSATQTSGNPLPSWLSFNSATRSFSGTPTAGDSGTLHVQVSGKDSGNLSAFDEFDIIVSSNVAPTGSVTISGTSTQGQTLTVSNTLADINGLGAISYQWIANGDMISGATSNTLILVEAHVGKLITVAASYTDWQGTAESITSSVTTAVVNVNDTPTVTSGAIGTVAENVATSTVVYTVVAADPDAGTIIAYSLSGIDAPAFNINASTGVVTLKTSANFEAKASYNIDVNASDGALSATRAISVNVSNVNETPMLTNAIADKLATTYSLFSFGLPGNTFSDVDTGDTLTWSAAQASGNPLPAWLAFNVGTHSFSGTPVAGDTGTLQVRVTGKDTSNLSVFDDFAIAVANNPVPTVAANTKAEVTATSPFSLGLASLFNDTEALSYQITGGTLPTGLSLANGVISGTVAAANLAAPAVINVLATDSLNQTVSTALKLYVSEIGAIIPTKPVRSGNTLTIDFLVDETKDPGGSNSGLTSLNVTIGYDASKLHYVSSAGFSKDLFIAGAPTESGSSGTVDLAWSAITPLTGHLARTMSLSFTVLQEGDFKLDIAPTDFDSVDLSSKSTHAWLSTITNIAPTVANPIADRSTAEDAAFSFAVPANSFTDLDAGDTLTFSATRADGSALPAWLSFNPATRTFSGTPANGDVGNLSLRVTATDTGNAKANEDFVLTITNVNDAPTLVNPIADRSTAEDAAFSFVVPANTFADVDVGDVLTYTATKADGSALPGWLGFNAATHTFSGTPLNGDVGSLNLRVTAKDTSNVSVSDDFVLTVTNTNDAPVAGTYSNKTASINQPVSLNLGALFTDVDVGDSLSFVATGLPTGLAINSATGLISGSAATGSAGVHHIAVTGTDSGGLAASLAFDLSVIAGHAVTASVVTRGGLALPGVTLHELVSTTPAGSLYAFKNLAVDTVAHTLNAELMTTGSSSDGALDATFRAAGGASFQSFDLTGAISSANDWSIITNTTVANSYGLGAIKIGAPIATDTLVGKLTLTLPATGTGGNVLDLADATLGSQSAPARSLAYTKADLGTNGQFSATLADSNAVLAMERGTTDLIIAGKKPITAADALDALKLSVGLNASLGNSWKELIAADMNHDGRVTAADALEILKTSVGINTIQPSWVFVPNDAAGLTGMTKSTVSYKDDWNLSSVTAPTVNTFTGILVGDVNNSWVIPT